MEKYQLNISNTLQKLHESQNMPHILLHGSYLSGKKTILSNFLNKVYDKNMYSSYVYQVDCCHQNGIKFIRDELKFFGKTQIRSSNIKYKSIILLNADFLTVEAQSSLRRIIELYSGTTRFFIITNNKEKLIPPIRSRFCEIYVARQKITKETNYRLPKSIQNTLLGLYDMSKKELTNVSELLYNNCFIYNDLIHFLQTNFDYGDEETSKIEDFKYKITHLKKEIRCDQFILFYVLYFFRFNLECKI